MFLDTNVPVRARFEAVPGHAIARRRMREAGESGEVLRIGRQGGTGVSGDGDPPAAMAPPVRMDAALEHGAAPGERSGMDEDGPGVADMPERLCREMPVAGGRVHDAGIVATMPAHGEHRLQALNGGDFRRCGARIGLVAWERPG